MREREGLRRGELDYESQGPARDDYGRATDGEPTRVGKRTRTETLAGHASRIPQVVKSVLRAERGAPLPDAAAWSERVGADVSRARVVTGSAAQEAARAIDARAFTVGNRVFLGEGAADPGTPAGDRVLAHELTHVAQQGDAEPTDDEIDGLTLTASGDAAEAEARDTASARRQGPPGRGRLQVARLAHADGESEAAAHPIVDTYGPATVPPGAESAPADAPEFRPTRADLVNDLWAMARVPGHALQKLSDAELRRVFDEVARRCEAGGSHKMKIGSYELQFTVVNGVLQNSTCKKKGFFSQIGGLLKVGLSFASFVPGPVGLAARAINAVAGVVKGIKSKNFFGALTSALGAVTAGAQVLGAKGVAAMATAGSRLLGGAKSTFDAIKNKSLAAGFAGLAEMAAAGASMAGGAGEKLAGFAKHMNDTARFLGAASKAKRAIDAAKRGDVAGAVGAGLEAFSEAAGPDSKLGQEAAKIAGYSTAARSAYDAIKQGNYAAAAAELAAVAAGAVHDPAAKKTLANISTALNGVQGLQDAFGTGDWMAVAASGAEIASVLARGKVGADIGAAGKVLRAADTLRAAIKGGDPDAIGAAAWALFDLTRNEVKAAAERHGPQILPKGRDLSGILASVPGVQDGGEQLVARPGMKPGETIVIGDDTTIPSEAPPSPPAPPAAQRPAAQPQPEAETPDPRVKRAQMLLNMWAYLTHRSLHAPENGLLDEATREALAAFQRTHPSLDASGELDPATLSLLERVSDDARELTRLIPEAQNRIGDARRLVTEARSHILLGNDTRVHVEQLAEQADRLEKLLAEIDDPTWLRTLIASLVEKMHDVETMLGMRGDQNVAIAGGVVFLADMTIKALGRECPPLMYAYFALREALPRLAQGADWRVALLQAGFGALWTRYQLEYAGLDGHVVEEVLAKELRVAGVDAAKRIVDDIGELKASSREDLRAKVEQALERRAIEFTAQVIVKTATGPLNNVNFDQEGYRVVREALKKVLEDNCKRNLADLLAAFPSGH